MADDLESGRITMGEVHRTLNKHMEDDAENFNKVWTRFDKWDARFWYLLLAVATGSLSSLAEIALHLQGK